MITVDHAFEIVLNHKVDFGTESVPLHHSLGRVLKEPLIADRDFPAFDRVTMDGIAINFAAIENGVSRFRIESIQPAGAPQQKLLDLHGCIEVMTGSVLPENTDTVIRYEDLSIENGNATVLEKNLVKNQNIHWKGSDTKKASEIIAANCLLGPAEIGVAASIGKAFLLVAKWPKIAMISTGDELVEVHETPLPHQIRTSNVYQISAALQRYGMETSRIHIKDDFEATKNKLEACLEGYDVILLSGGVSKGKWDFVPAALEDLGVQPLFHGVRQKPGKPFWFGTNKAGKTVFALPGNPVSAFLCLNRYVIPWLKLTTGQPIPLEKGMAKLAAPIRFKPELTYFVQARIVNGADGSLMAVPAMNNGSGDLTSLTNGNAFLELPSEKSIFEAGEVYPFFYY